MGIEEKEVSHIAQLARLKLSKEEIRLFQDQLGRILKHIEDLKKLDTEKVSPTSHVLGLTNILREDEPRPFKDQKRILENAPESEGPYFKVPKVIE